MAKRIDAMAVSFIVATAIMLGSSKAWAYDWLQFNGDPQHSGNNTAETIISPANVASLTRKFQIDLPAVVDGAPVLLQGVTTATGVRDVLFVTTTGGDLVAIDAQTGIQLWVRRHPAGMCTVNNGLAPCYTTSSPAIDPNRQLVYSYGLDGYVHKHRIFDGTEIMDGTWPELTTTKGFDEKGSSALALATSKGVTYLYAVHGGYPGDRGDYQGHVTAIELATGAQRVFNAM